MRKISTFSLRCLPLLSCLAALSVAAQNPVGVPDTIDVFNLDTIITVSVLDNDYNPGGQPIHITNAPNCLSFTDSTVSLDLRYTQYMNNHGLRLIAVYYITEEMTFTNRIPIYARFHNQYFDSLDINGINARINSRGVQFLDLDSFEMRYEVPKGGGVGSIYSHGLWIGGFDSNGELHLAGDYYCYSGQDFNPGPVSDSLYYNSQFDNHWNRVWKISRTEVEYHRSHWWMSSYLAPEAILSWPANGDTSKGQAALLAPFQDENNNGIYEPLLGDFPSIRGDQSIFFILNDIRGPHLSTFGNPFGIEVHVMAYAFNCPADTALWNTTFIHYDIINRSSATYPETYIGTYNDFDLGNIWDDRNQCDVARSSLIGYNGIAVDGLGSTDNYGYGAYPPAISATILGGPYLDPDGIDNPDTLPDGSRICGPNINGSNFGDGIPDNERLGLSYSYHRVEMGYSPTTPMSHFNLMRGYWYSGEHFKYGGAGNIYQGSTNMDCKYLFPGVSDPCNYGTYGMQPPGYLTGAGGSGVSWTEESSGFQPYDRRGIISSGPVTLHPGGSQQLDLAFVWARQFSDTAHDAVLPLLRHHIDQIREYYSKDSTPCGGSFSLIPEIETTTDILIYPNPAGPIVNLRYPASGREAEYRLYNLMGAKVDEGRLNPEGVDEISLAALPRGMYILHVSSGKQTFTARLIHY